MFPFCAPYFFMDARYSLYPVLSNFSAFPTTSFFIFSEYAFNRERSSGSEAARIFAARIPAFFPPLMATVATGMPEGIWTME